MGNKKLGLSKILSQYKNMSIQAKAAIWFVICSLLQKGISFITVPIFTRMLKPEQYGTYSLYLSWLQIFTIVTSLYLYYGVFNNAMIKFENDKDRYISSMQGLTLTINTIVFIIYLVAYEFWSELIGLSPFIIVLMFIEMMVTPSLSFWSVRQRFEYKYKKLVFVTLSKSLANPIIGIIAVSLTDKKDTARVMSVVLVELIFCGTIMIYQLVKGRCLFDKKYWKYALSMAIPLLPHYLSGMILSQGDRMMIDRMVGKPEVAFYSVAYSIGMLVQIFTNSINNSFTPWMYQKLKAKNYEGIASTVNIMLLIIGVLAFCLMIMSPELVLIFGSQKYADAVYVIPPVSASVYFVFLYNVLATPQFYFEKTKFLMMSSVLAAIINIVLNYVFINMFGYVAAGYTTLVCYILYSVGHYIVSSMVLQKHLSDIKIFDKKIIFLVSFVVIVLGAGCNLIFPYRFIRYVVLIVVFVFWVVKRKMIFGFIKGLKKR